MRKIPGLGSVITLDLALEASALGKDSVASEGASIETLVTWAGIRSCPAPRRAALLVVAEPLVAGASPAELGRLYSQRNTFRVKILTVGERMPSNGKSSKPTIV
jgi:hypothetical protein